MKADLSNPVTIAFSGKFTIARGELESLLLRVMPQSHDAERHDAQPSAEPPQSKATQKEVGNPTPLTLSMRETAELLGVFGSSGKFIRRLGKLPSVRSDFGRLAIEN